MGNQLLPQNDFFIYVPLLQSHKLHSHDTVVDEKSNILIDTNLPTELRAWVKIPLADTVCVYVSPDLAYKEMVC